MADENPPQLLISNCPLRPRSIEWEFQCPESWENLSDGKDPKVRACEVCQKNVHLVETDEELGRAIRLNQCIAVEAPKDLMALMPERKVRDAADDQPVYFTLGRPKVEIGPHTKSLFGPVTKETYEPFYRKRLERKMKPKT